MPDLGKHVSNKFKYYSDSIGWVQYWKKNSSYCESHESQLSRTLNAHISNKINKNLGFLFIFSCCQKTNVYCYFCLFWRVIFLRCSYDFVFILLARIWKAVRAIDQSKFASHQIAIAYSHRNYNVAGKNTSSFTPYYAHIYNVVVLKYLHICGGM